MENLNEGLRQFTGSENFYKHAGGFILTEGARDTAENYGVFWFLDIICSYQLSKKFQNEDFQTWEILKDDKGNFKVEATDGRDNILVIQEIPLCDFEHDKLTFWFINNTVLLPSEN